MVRALRTYSIAVVVVVLSWLGISPLERCYAAEVRVFDAAGLVRAVKVIREKARIVVTVSKQNAQEGVTSASGECWATNIDGLTSEKRVLISATGECVFTDVTEGSWQIRVPDSRAWRVQIYE